MSKCICDKCHKEMDINETVLEYKPKYNIIVKGIKCDNCDATYITNVLDSNLVASINEAYIVKNDIDKINKQMESEYNSYKNEVIPHEIRVKYMDLLTIAHSKYKKQVESNYRRELELRKMYFKGDYDD